MKATELSRDEIVDRGEALYEQSIRSKVETADNIGKPLVIDVETGDYLIEEKGTDAADILRAKHPDANVYGLRIGYRSMESFAGMRVPKAQ